MNDHQVSLKHMGIGGEGARVCAHVPLRRSSLARIGRPDLLWTMRTQLVKEDWHDQSLILVKQSMTGSTATNQIED